jgi:hypothetical protein
VENAKNALLISAENVMVIKTSVLNVLLPTEWKPPLELPPNNAKPVTGNVSNVIAERTALCVPIHMF